MPPISPDGSFSPSPLPPRQDTSSHLTFPRNARSRRQPPLLLPLPNKPNATLTQHATATTKLLHSIADFIRSDSFLFGPADLALSVSPKTFFGLQHELDNPRTLTGKEADSLRYDYSPETETLTIPCMPTPIHDAISGFVDYILIMMREGNFLSLAERLSLMHNSNVDVGLPTLRSLSRAGTKGGERSTAKKQPDAAIYFISDVRIVDSDVFPRVVFEVAFSQTYESVVEDARHWLLRTEGEVKLVVIVKLVEGKHDAAEADSEEIEKKGLEQRLGNGGALEDADGADFRESDAGHGGGAGGGENTDNDQKADPGTSGSTSPSPSSQSSTAKDYKSHFQSDPSLWVGPITGFIELYRYDAETKSMFQDGPRCDIFSDSSPPPNIKITDLLPHTYISGDPNRAFPLPLENYRGHIARETRKLATIRISHQRQQVQKRKFGDRSGEYEPGEYEPGEDEDEDEGQGQDVDVEGEVPRRIKRSRVG